MIEQLKETCLGMPRAFCVNNIKLKYNIETGKTVLEYWNDRVLVGETEKVDAALNILSELV